MTQCLIYYLYPFKQQIHFQYGLESDYYPLDYNRFSGILKIMNIILLEAIFNEYKNKNHKINTSF